MLENRDIHYGSGCSLKGKQNQNILDTSTLLKTQENNYLGFWKHLFPF